MFEEHLRRADVSEFRTGHQSVSLFAIAATVPIVVLATVISVVLVGFTVVGLARLIAVVV